MAEPDFERWHRETKYASYAVVPSAEQLRIEALRAAAVICANPSFFRSGDYLADTLGLAEPLAHWLETGEREK